MLIDAFLLDAHRDKREIWISLRRDGIRGSGSQEDPYSGNTVLTHQVTGNVFFDPLDVIALADKAHGYLTDPLNPIKISGASTVAASLFNSTSGHSITRLNDFAFSFKVPSSPLALDHPPFRGILINVSAQKASDPAKSVELYWPILKVTTDAPHGFNDREVIRLTGNSDPVLNGDFLIFCLSPTSFAIWPNRVPFRPPNGKLGEVTCGRAVFFFDLAMRNAPDGAAIHIGPGVFETQGLPEGVTEDNEYKAFFTWRPRSGQHISGAGMGATTVKLVGAYLFNKKYSVMLSGKPLDGCEIRDLTIDCNIESQPRRFLILGAISLTGGRHLRVRRVRALNFASHSIGIYQENFVFITGASNSGETNDQVFEDCIAESLGPNSHYNSFCFAMGGGEYHDADGVTFYSRGCTIRNCLGDARIEYGPRVPITSVAYEVESGYVTVVTSEPHGRTYPDNVIVQGVPEIAELSLVVNGVFEIVEVTSSTRLIYRGPTAESLDLAGEWDESIIYPTVAAATLGGRVPSYPISIASIQPVLGTERSYRLTTRTPHFRTRNNNVAVDAGGGAGGFNGVFPVDSYEPARPNELVYTLLSAGGQPDAYGGVVNISHVGLGAEPGSGAVVAGNRISYVSIGGPYQDTFASRDLVTRDNYYYDVNAGPAQFRTRLSLWTGITTVASLERLGSGSPGNRIAKVTTVDPHGLTALDVIDIEGVNAMKVGGVIISDDATAAAAARFNGRFAILVEPAPEPPDPKVFYYAVTQDLPEGEAFVKEVPTNRKPGYRFFDSVWETGRRPLKSLLVNEVKVNGVKKWRVTAQMLPVPDVMGAVKSQRHGLEVGDGILVIRAGFFRETKQPFFNGYFRITAVPSDIAFQYDLDVDPNRRNGAEAEFSPGYFALLWGARRLMIENNLIEMGLRPSLLPRNFGDFRHGISLYAGRVPPTQEVGELSNPPFMGQAIVRGNVIRRVADDPLPGGIKNKTGILMTSWQSALAEDNWIDLDYAEKAIVHAYRNPAYIHTAGNLGPNGETLRSGDGEVFGLSPDLRTDLEDVQALALLNL